MSKGGRSFPGFEGPARASLLLRFSVGARKMLVTPLAARSLGWQVAIPFLAAASIVFACVAACRRFLRLKRQAASRVVLRGGGADSAQPGAPFRAILACGNLVAGGSGKSPLVRVLAKHLLETGHHVVVASRGYGAPGHARGVFVVDTESASSCPSTLEEVALADELRELVAQCRSWVANRDACATFGRLLVAQDPDRERGLLAASQLLRRLGSPALPLIGLLDDGLQSQHCHRDLDVCLWPVAECAKAPRFALPLGLFREGFGHASLARLAARCPVHVLNFGLDAGLGGWGPRTFGTAAHEPRGGAENPPALPFADILPWPACASRRGPAVLAMTSQLRWQDRQGREIDLGKSMAGRNPLVVTGIAAPERFVDGVRRALRSGHGDVLAASPLTLHLGDHARFDASLVLRLQSGAGVVSHRGWALCLTLKDYSRWRDDASFASLADSVDVFIGVLDVKLQWIAGGSPQPSTQGDTASVVDALVKTALKARAELPE